MQVTEHAELDESLLAAKRKLIARIKQGRPAPASKVSKLKLAEVIEMPSVFQHRSNNQAASECHVWELVSVLQRDSGQALAPITVYWVGDGYCCIDGHHRMMAYKEVQHKGAIPVNVFTGTLDNALLLSLSSNSKDKLPMSAREKYNAAWRLVIGTSSSKAGIAKAANVSDRLVGKMRATMKTLSEQRPERQLDSLSWNDALRMEQGQDVKDFVGSDDWVEVEAKKLADRLSRTFGNRLSKNSEVLYRALEIYDGRIPEWIADYYAPPEDDLDGDVPLRGLQDGEEF